MRKVTLYSAVAALLAVGILLYVQQQRRAELIDEGQRVSVALAASAERVEFRWDLQSCPAENAAIFADWTRRLVDAEAQTALVSAKLGATDPEVSGFSTPF